MTLGFDDWAAPAPNPTSGRVLGVPEALFHFVAGALLAAVFAALPFLCYMGWFLASLAHEMGHCAVALFFGMPAVPAISLGGEAAAVHGEPILLLRLGIVAALAAGAWRLREPAWRYTAVGAVLVVYPLLAWTDARELLHLVGGHGAELAFGLICFHRALTGGFTSSGVERSLYSMLGWTMVGKNVVLTVGLVFSERARDAYRTNGSFGFRNDYLRVADHLNVSVELVALAMLLPALLVVPTAIGVYHVGRRR